jgi:hypothetical protein
MVIRSGRFGAGLLLALVLSAAVPARAAAQSSIGFTGGLSVDPEQVYGGVFWQSPDIGGRFKIRTGIDGGVGDNLRLGVINLDFIYAFPIGSGPWTFVTGGGPAVVIIRPQSDLFDLRGDVAAGGSYLFGFGHEKGFFTDIRIGGGNTPSLKLGVGWAVKIY